MRFWLDSRPRQAVVAPVDELRHQIRAEVVANPAGHVGVALAGGMRAGIGHQQAVDPSGTSSVVSMARTPPAEWPARISGGACRGWPVPRACRRPLAGPGRGLGEPVAQYLPVSAGNPHIGEHDSRVEHVPRQEPDGRPVVVSDMLTGAWPTVNRGFLVLD